MSDALLLFHQFPSVQDAQEFATAAVNQFGSQSVVYVPCLTKSGMPLVIMASPTYLYSVEAIQNFCFRTTLLVSRYGGSFWGYLAGGGA